MVVVVTGQTGFPELAQLFGRCGRGDRPGLAIHLVEKGQNKNPMGLNGNSTKEMTNDELMNGFASTGICLRVALSLGNT